jgi:hypothetical protein
MMRKSDVRILADSSDMRNPSTFFLTQVFRSRKCLSTKITFAAQVKIDKCLSTKITFAAQVKIDNSIVPEFQHSKIMAVKLAASGFLNKKTKHQLLSEESLAHQKCFQIVWA